MGLPAFLPRDLSILASILTVVQFLCLIYALIQTPPAKEAAVTIVVFALVCIPASVALFIGAVRLNRKLIIPYILSMGLFVCSYFIIFVVMNKGNMPHEKYWIHFAGLGVDVYFLLAVGVLYQEISKAEKAAAIQAAVNLAMVTLVKENPAMPT